MSNGDWVAGALILLLSIFTSVVVTINEVNKSWENFIVDNPQGVATVRSKVFAHREYKKLERKYHDGKF